MASKLVVLLSLALVAIAIASPIPANDDIDATTQADDDSGEPLVEVIEVIETIPVVPLVAAIEDATTTEASAETKEAGHKVVKRSALRGDNPSNDLLADLEGLKYDNGLSGITGRRIKFLPTWLG